MVILGIIGGQEILLLLGLVVVVALLFFVTKKKSDYFTSNNSMKSKGTAYLLWLISIFGWLGFQHFYLGKIGKGIIWILTGGFFGIGSLIDLFTLGGAVDNHNTKTELETIRTATMANATK